MSALKLSCTAVLLLSLVESVPFRSTKTAPYVYIVGMWPDSGSLRRSLSRSFTKAIMDANRSRKLRTFKLSNEEASLVSFGPEETLNTYCEKVVNKRANSMVVLNNGPVFGVHVALDGYLFQLADSLKIPVIAWNSDHTAASVVPQDALIINLAPSLHHQVEAMMSILRTYDWASFSVITTLRPGYRVFISALRKVSRTTPAWLVKDDRGVAHVRRFKLMSEVTLIDDRNRTYIRHELEKVKHSDCRVFLFFASRLEAMTILEVATSLNLTGSEYMWIVSQSIVEERTRASKAFPIGILGIYFAAGRQLMPQVVNNAVRIWVAAQVAIYRNESLRKIPDIFRPNMSCSGNKPVAWKHGRILYEHMKQVRSVPGVKLDSNGQQTDVKIKIKNLNRDRLWKEVGTWDRDNGLEITDITWPDDSGRPPKGRPSKYHLKILTLSEPPYVNYEPAEEDGTCGKRRGLECTIYIRIGSGRNSTTNGTVKQCCTGLNMDLLQRLSEELDFDFELWEVEDGYWGGIDEVTKEMNGLIRALMDGKADMAVTSLKVNTMRAAAVDFSVSYMETGIAIIVAIREGAISATAFLKPYDYPSWCLILLFSVHATGAAVFVFEWLSPRGMHRGQAVTAENTFSLCRAFWMMWAMLFQATVTVYNPRGMASRFLSNLWALFAVFFLAHYTANLAAFMITESEFYDLSGIQDRRLIDPYQTKPPFRFATVPYGSTEANLKNTHPKMYKYMRNFSRINVTEGIEAVKKNAIDAFIYDATVLEYWAGKDKGCKLLTVGNWYAMTGYGVAFPRGSKWRQPVNDVLLRMIENGDMQRLRAFWMRGACQTSKEEKQTSHALGILNFTSAFILLVCGMIIGALFLTIEHCFFKFGRKYLREIDKCGVCGLISLSMGKSLTFEQSVMEAMVLSRSHRCQEPACEEHVLAIQRELDLALFKVEKLSNKLSDLGINQEHQLSTWRPPETDRRQTGVVTESPTLSRQYASGTPSSSHKLRQSPPASSKAIQAASHERDDRNSSHSTQRDRSIPHDSVYSSNGLPSTYERKKSESEGNLGQKPLRRSPSYASAVSSEDVQKSPTKVRYHDGNYYVEVNKQPEVETVL